MFSTYTERLQTAATCSLKSEFERNLIGIGGENGKRSRADVAETDHTNVNVSHVLKELS